MLNERERIEIDELKQRYSEAAEAGGPAPAGYEICPEDFYDFAVHVISKTYGISKHEAGKYSETDYARLVIFNNLEIMRNDGIYKSKYGEQNN